MRRRLRDRLRGCADAGHGFSFPYCVDASNEPNEYCDSIDITLMKTAKQEHDANISGLRRLCYGWILSPVRMVAFLAASHACHSVAFRITDSCSLWCGGGLTPCFLTVVKMSVLCKNGDLKMSILCKTKLLKLSVLCILCLECYDSQYICRDDRGLQC